MGWKNKFTGILKGWNNSFLSNPLCRRLDAPYLKLSPFLFLKLWLGFQRQTKQKFSECCILVGGIYLKLLQEFPCASVTERRSFVLQFSLNQNQWCTRRVFCGLLFYPWEGILIFFLFFFTILFPNPTFSQLSKVHLENGALEGSRRNSEQKFLHLSRMTFTLLTIHSD